MSDPTSFNRTSHPGHGAGPAGASLSDLLTAVQHVASNIATAAERYMRAQGESVSAGITAATVLKQGRGRVVVVSVTAETGSTPGKLIDATLATATGPVLYQIPSTVGLYTVNMPFNLGLVVAPASGMTVAVSYS